MKTIIHILKISEIRIKEVINNLHEEQFKKSIELGQKVREIKNEEKIYNEISSKLLLYNISIETIEGQKSSLLNLIHEKDIKDNNEYYKLAIDEVKREMESLEKPINHYLSIKKKYEDCDSLSIKELYKQKIEKIKELNNLVTKYDRIVKLSTEISQYYINRDIQNKINEINDSIVKLEKEKKVILLIKNDYEKLFNSSRKIIEDETQRMLEIYKESIRNFYNYLCPSLFLRNLDIRIDNKNPKNNRLIFEVYDSKNKKMNPSYIFSAAQNNVLAISIFLSVAICQNWSNLQFLLMDDPIQNMDDINVHSFVDIIRAVIKKTNKQIFISTHDDRVSNFMLNKFKGNIQTIKLDGYGQVF